MSDARVINSHLKELWGVNLFGEPNFRLSWSDDRMEKRRIELFGDILRNSFKLVPCYPHIRNRWILERYFPPEKSYHPDLPDSNRGVYECIYVFEDKDGNPLPLLERACDFLIKRILNPERYLNRKAQLKDEAEKKDEQEIKEYEDNSELADATPIASALHDKEGIIVP